MTVERCCASEDCSATLRQGTGAYSVKVTISTVIPFSHYAQKVHQIDSIHYYNGCLKGTDMNTAFCVYVMGQIQYVMRRIMYVLEQIWYVMGRIQCVMYESILWCIALIQFGMLPE